jgi:hypothetical protein
MRRKLFVVMILYTLLLAACKEQPPLLAEADTQTQENEQIQDEALSAELLGLVTFETGARFADTEIGGLSSITYDEQNDVYLVLSDDRGRPDNPRFYTVSIAPDGSEVTFTAVTFLLNAEGKPLKTGQIDPEGIAWSGETLFMASEGEAEMYPPLPPTVQLFTRSGEWIEQLTIPEKFLPDGFGKYGVRGNKAFETLTLSPDGEILTTAVENALVQDGPIASVEDESLARLLLFDLITGQPLAEYVYAVGTVPVANASRSDDNGLVELIALDNAGNYLALERSYVAGFGNTIQLFRTSTRGATDVSGREALWDADTDTPLDFVPMQKTRLINLADLGFDPDNVEGMALGPLLPDGRQVLVLVSDNNFNPGQITQFIVLAITLE